MPKPYVVEKIRRQVEHGLRKKGIAILIRKAWTLQDLENGEVSRCSVCYNDVYRNAEDPKCPTCFGTGFEGGYRDRQLARVVISLGGFDVERSKDSVEPSWTVQGQIGHSPIVADGDLIAEVTGLDKNDTPLSIGAVYVIDGQVKYHTIFGSEIYDHGGGAFDFDGTLIFQEFNANVLIDNDIRVSESFWGV